MYEWDDILIVGDSFCAERDQLYHWPVIFANKLTNENKINPRGKGYGGASWWSTRKKLIEELNQLSAKIVIICHTEPNRIPNDHDYSLNYSNVQYQILKNNKNKIFDAAEKYYKHLYSSIFLEWAQNRWFSELDEYLSKISIEKVIHLHCFPTKDRNPHIFKIGFTMNGFLFDYCDPTFPDDHPNHMTLELNEKFANYLISVIENYQGDGRCIPGMIF